MLDRVWVAVAAALPVAWLVVHAGGLAGDHLAIALWSGFGIFGAAFLLSWACEVLQLDVPQALALALLALIAVLPEYAVDMYFAWQAGKDPTYTGFAMANMTGANRLLLGVGWAVPVLVSWLRGDGTIVRLPREGAVEVRYLAIATLYSFVIPWKDTLSWVDAAFLLLLFATYVRAAGRAHHEEPELEGPALMIAALGRRRRRLVVGLLGVLAGVTIFTAAEPFAESLIAIGRSLGVDEFLLVQWLAPFASESPEFIVAVLFAVRGAAAAGISTMISSKVNQWTLLVGALPLAFALSAGSLAPMHLDARQQEEIFLTSAQSLFGLLIIADYAFRRGEALALFGLFALQFCFPSPHARWIFAWGYIGLATVMFLASRDARQALLALLRLPGGRSPRAAQS